MRSRLLFLLPLLLSLFSTAPAAAITVVNVVDGPNGSFDFSPRIVYINRGDTVKWVNTTSGTHTATGGITPNQDGTSPINSPFLGPSGTYQVSFPNMGFFRFFCQVHPDMTGMVRVGHAFISMKNFNYTPATLSVGLGDTVTWRNDTPTTTHNSSSGTAPTPDGTWDSGLLGPGDTFDYIPASTGSFPYFCQVHGAIMHGTLNVTAGQLAGVGAGPTRTRLFAARPNPASRDVTLAFELAQPGQARLTISDAAGRRVTTLVNANLSAGHHELHWSGRTSVGRAAGNGVYYYRLEAGGLSSTRKFTWVR